MEAVQQNSPNALGDMIERLAELRDMKRDLNDQIKEINEEYGEIERRVLDHLDQQGTQMSGSSRHRVSISEQTVPSVTDWEALREYIQDNDALYLLERRVASAPWRELVESGEAVPGTEPYTRRSLSLRKL